MLSKKLKEGIRCINVLGEDAGEVNSSLESLTLQDLNVKPKIGETLRDHLPIFATAEEIILVRQIAKTKPEILDQVREDQDERGSQSKGTSKTTGPCQCRNCKKKKDKENR